MIFSYISWWLGVSSLLSVLQVTKMYLLLQLISKIDFILVKHAIYSFSIQSLLILLLLLTRSFVYDFSIDELDLFVMYFLHLSQLQEYEKTPLINKLWNKVSTSPPNCWTFNYLYGWLILFESTLGFVDLFAICFLGLAVNFYKLGEIIYIFDIGRRLILLPHIIYL